HVILHEGEYLSTWGLHQIGPRQVRVESISIDDLLGDFEKVDLMKVDIEGQENQALLGAQNLGRVHHLSFANVSSNRSQLEAKLRDLGFTLRFPRSLGQVEENVDAVRTSPQSTDQTSRITHNW